MKKIVFFVIILLQMGCSEDFLERAPLSDVTTENFYKSESDITAAINAAYDPLQHLHMYKYSGWRWGAKTDEMYRAFDYFNFAETPTSAASNNTWSDLYQGILATNVVINKAPEAEITDAFETRVLGEAHFLRGFYYFHLVRWFGAVPIITEVPTTKTNFQIPRNTVEEVYDRIIADLTTAIEQLPSKSEYSSQDAGRATKGAAQTILAEVYLYRAAPGDYEKVLQLTEQVIQSNQYQLEENYADIFKLENENGKESIFEVQFQKGGPTAGHSNQGDGSSYNQYVAVFNSTSIREPFYFQWDDDDLRKDIATFIPGETINDIKNTSAFYKQGKWILGSPGPDKVAGNNNDSPMNFMVERYANILLMRAEVLNELNASPPAEAIGYINQLRDRADLPDVPLSISKEEFRQIIREEKKYELSFEGHRWFDLLRYERMGFGGGVTDILANPESDFYNANASFPKHYLSPIPQVEIDRNPMLSQNPDY